MENYSGINPIPGNFGTPRAYFTSLSLIRPQSIEDCEKLKREASEVFKNLETTFNNSIQKLKGSELSVGKMFEIQNESMKLSEIRDVYELAMDSLNNIEQILITEDKIKTDELNAHNKDEKP